jgi:hypothetical protein
MLPLWQRGMEGDFKNICLFIIHKISPNPSFPKRGIRKAPDLFYDFLDACKRAWVAKIKKEDET